MSGEGKNAFSLWTLICASWRALLVLRHVVPCRSQCCVVLFNIKIKVEERWNHLSVFLLSSHLPRARLQRLHRELISSTPQLLNMKAIEDDVFPPSTKSRVPVDQRRCRRSRVCNFRFALWRFSTHSALSPLLFERLLGIIFILFIKMKIFSLLTLP